MSITSELNKLAFEALNECVNKLIDEEDDVAGTSAVVEKTG